MKKILCAVALLLTPAPVMAARVFDEALQQCVEVASGTTDKRCLVVDAAIVTPGVVAAGLFAADAGLAYGIAAAAILLMSGASTPSSQN